jgi:hypothetical protein
MKWIKPYKLFESKINLNDDLKDICLELSDEGFEIDINSKDPFYRITIFKSLGVADVEFPIKKCKDVILRIIQFCKLNEYSVRIYSYIGSPWCTPARTDITNMINKNSFLMGLRGRGYKYSNKISIRIVSNEVIKNNPGIL